jgi:hypothetical protein
LNADSNSSGSSSTWTEHKSILGCNLLTNTLSIVFNHNCILAS